MKKLLERQENLDLKQAEICQVLFDDNHNVTGVVTHLGTQYNTKAVIIATGTYLKGKIYVGEASYYSGPDGFHAAMSLSQSLTRAGIELRRFKTGTPARVIREVLILPTLKCKTAMKTRCLCLMTRGEVKNTLPCHIDYTNEETHKVITRNIDRSPLYGLKTIEGIGPRYCPSLEDKVMRFSDKPRHQFFIEPCGYETDEMYLQGLSSSLPEEVQVEFYKTIKGFEHLEVMRPAYAIEYD